MKPCPICGNEIEIKRMDYDGGDQFYITCRKCELVSPFSCKSFNEAEDRWNELWCWTVIPSVPLPDSFSNVVSMTKYNELLDKNFSLETRLKQLFEAYLVTRLEYSGSWGNLSVGRRREVTRDEILAELKWKD